MSEADPVSNIIIGSGLLKATLSLVNEVSDVEIPCPARRSVGWRVIWGGRGGRWRWSSQSYDLDHPPAILTSLLVIFFIDSVRRGNDIDQSDCWSNLVKLEDKGGMSVVW